MSVWLGVSLLMLLSGLWIFCSVRKHMLSLLLSLEYMAVAIFLFLLVFLSKNLFLFSLIYLIMTACEGALGLSILVIMSRSHGGII